MKKTITQSFLLCITLLAGKSIHAQDYLLESTFLGSRSQILLSLAFQQPVDYGVDLYRIVYLTNGSDNMPDTASGLLVIPQVPASTLLPMVIYAHGTTDGPTDVPSQLRGGYEVAMAYAAFGFITLAPDYLGLGTSRGFHPYVHAATESSASIDMLNGSLEYLESNEPEWDPNFLFLAGYSQGGHASMALHREMEEIWSLTYPVTATTHMSGPYSISGVMRDLILSDVSYGSPAYTAYILLGYQAVYGTIFNDVAEVYNEPFASHVDSFYTGLVGLGHLNDQLIAALAVDGDTINKRMFQDSIIQAIISQPDHRINVALRDNDTYDWAPTAPTRLYYCGGDEQVPFQNSLIAESAMQANGAVDIDAIELHPTYSHGECVLPAIIESIEFFSSFVDASALENLNKNAAELSIFPNPVLNELVIDWENAKTGMEYEIINTNGQSIAYGHSYLNRISVDQLVSGMYMIICTAGGETRVARFIHP